MSEKLRTEYKYIIFEQYAQPKGRKTSIWCIKTRSQGVYLGDIRWRCGWRQYVFSPEDDSHFSISCMADIMDFVKQLMDARKK